MSYSNDSACKILSDKEFLSLYADTNEYHQASPNNPIYAFIEFEFEYPLKDSTEIIVYGDTENIVPYKGQAKKQVRLVFDKQDEQGVYEEEGVEYFQSHITVRVYDKKSQAVCTYVSGSGIRLPNLKGGNKFLFKMTHPHDEERQPMSSFSIKHLP